MIQKIILLALLLSTFLYADKVYSGTAHHEHKSYFKKTDRSYAMTITFKDNNRVILSLPEYNCVSELIMQSKNANVITYAEKHISGQCNLDDQADTQIRIREGALDYLYQSNTDNISALLQESK